MGRVAAAIAPPEGGGRPLPRPVYGQVHGAVQRLEHGWARP